MSPLPTPRYGRTPLADIHPSFGLFIPHVPHRVFLFEILSQVGEIDSVDWISTQDEGGKRQAYVHFTVWYDTPVAEELYSTLMEGQSYRLYDDKESGKYLICRQNLRPVPRYRGSYTRDYLIKAVRTLEMAYKYGRCCVLKPKHIRFDQKTGAPTVVEYFVPSSEMVEAEDGDDDYGWVDMRNIHQLAADYEWWIQTTLTQMSTLPCPI